MRGFTLVELTVVIILLGILSTVAVPRLLDVRTEAEKGVLTKSLDSLRSGVNMELYRSRSTGGSSYPNTLTDAVQGGIPDHPQNTFGIATVQVADNATVLDPTYKVLKAGVAGAYWYNKANGTVKARVSDIGTESATLDFYNEVNGTNVTSLGNYSGGGGGGS